MLAYYNERAQEHDLVYTGKGPALRQYAADYETDVAKICRMASGFGCGNAIDIACGTGFWAPYYASNCRSVTFLDQSANMLSECRKRFTSLRLTTTAHYIQGNFFEIPMEASAFDCALTGFLLSHFLAEEEEIFFGRLKEIVRPSACLTVIDSAWSEKRQEYRRKAGVEERVLEDGRTFRVYKKYFEQSEIEEMLEKHSFSIESIYVGDMLFGVIASRVC